jgi:hypothetical protein
LPTDPSATSPGKSRWVQNPTLVVEQKLVVKFRVRGWGVKEVDDPALVAALMKGGSEMNPHVVQAMLREGVFVDEADTPREVGFRAPLSFRQPPLVPKSGMSQSTASALALNPALHWQRGKAIPKGIRQRAWNVQPGPVLWVEDPNTSMLFPWWPDGGVQTCVEALQSRRVTPGELTVRQRRVLVAARILLSAADARPGRFAQICEGAQKPLQNDQFVALRNLFSPLQLAHLRAYFRAVEREGYLSRSDSQVQRRRSLYREPLSTAIHQQLAGLVSTVTARPLRPSYSFFGVYLPGAVLEKHKDRPQCEWNLSLIWDTRPEKDRARAWPIYLEVDGRPRRVNLGMGDALLYRGTELFHWRNPQPARNFTTATFFHFVGEGFGGSLD